MFESGCDMASMYLKAALAKIQVVNQVNNYQMEPKTCSLHFFVSLLVCPPVRIGCVRLCLTIL